MPDGQSPPQAFWRCCRCLPACGAHAGTHLERRRGEGAALFVHPASLGGREAGQSQSQPLAGTAQASPGHLPRAGGEGSGHILLGKAPAVCLACALGVGAAAPAAGRLASWSGGDLLPSLPRLTGGACQPPASKPKSWVSGRKAPESVPWTRGGERALEHTQSASSAAAALAGWGGAKACSSNPSPPFQATSPLGGQGRAAPSKAFPQQPSGIRIPSRGEWGALSGALVPTLATHI